MKWNIANALTLGNLGFGFAAIVFNDPFWSPLFIVAGAILDVFDGAVARKLGFEGPLGKELDSLSDVVTFGIAPAYLYLQIAPDYIHPMISFFCVLSFPLGAAFRLAKFNTLPPSREFRGLPSPAGGLFFAAWVWATAQPDSMIETLHQHAWLYLCLPILFALFMNIPSPFFSIKNVTPDWKKAGPHLLLLGITILLFVFLPHDAAAFSILFYILISLLRSPFQQNTT